MSYSPSRYRRYTSNYDRDYRHRERSPPDRDDFDNLNFDWYPRENFEENNAARNEGYLEAQRKYLPEISELKINLQIEQWKNARLEAEQKRLREKVAKLKREKERLKREQTSPPVLLRLPMRPRKRTARPRVEQEEEPEEDEEEEEPEEQDEEEENLPSLDSSSE